MSILPTLDTTIILNGIKEVYPIKKDITTKEARNLLYEYFESKGVINREQLSSKPKEDQLCVAFDTIYTIHSTKLSGAVVSYWLGPYDLNGHCFQPDKAIIVMTKAGYKLTNEKFIAVNFVVNSSSGSSIYGYDYEYGGRGTIRNFKANLE